VHEGDTTAVRERRGFYHAACWLSRIGADAAGTHQLTAR
jgi:hypothetical protein